MAVWAIGDLHLSFGVPGKAMDRFGESWVNHPDKIAKAWRSKISSDDLILIPGDISWAMRLEDALPDLEWIDALPGTKVMIRGNHDYWWNSLNQILKVLPPSLHLIQNNVFIWNTIAIAGARLWDSSEYSFNSHILYNSLSTEEPAPTLDSAEKEAYLKEQEKIFARELLRLESSLKAIPVTCTQRLAMTHYPPIGPMATPSRASKLLSRFGVQHCVFGHLHSIDKNNPPPFGLSEEVYYHLTSADYLDFDPIRVI